MNSCVNTQTKDILLNSIHTCIVQKMNIAEQIDNAMKSFRPRAMSQAELSRRSGVPQPTISRTLKGATVPDIGTLTNLAKVLNITFNGFDLVESTQSNPPTKKLSSAEIELLGHFNCIKSSDDRRKVIIFAQGMAATQEMTVSQKKSSSHPSAAKAKKAA